MILHYLKNRKKEIVCLCVWVKAHKCWATFHITFWSLWVRWKPSILTKSQSVRARSMCLIVINEMSLFKFNSIGSLFDDTTMAKLIHWIGFCAPISIFRFWILFFFLFLFNAMFSLSLFLSVSVCVDSCCLCTLCTASDFFLHFLSAHRNVIGCAWRYINITSK